MQNTLRYDRSLLLLGTKRNAVLDLEEVQRYGLDSYGDPDYVTIYGLRPAEWYARGIRVLGRTAVECTRDELADAIGREISAIARQTANAPCTVIDPFAGSGNTLYWILRHMPGAQAVGFEADDEVFALTQSNLRLLSLPVSIVHADYCSKLAEIPEPAGLLVAFIAPPWGQALSTNSGLDLSRTIPPVADILTTLRQHFARTRLLCAIQVHEHLESSSAEDVRQQFDWSALRVFQLNAPGENHGALLGTIGWAPSA